MWEACRLLLPGFLSVVRAETKTVVGVHRLTGSGDVGLVVRVRERVWTAKEDSGVRLESKPPVTAFGVHLASKVYYCKSFVFSGGCL